MGTSSPQSLCQKLNFQVAKIHCILVFPSLPYGIQLLKVDYIVAQGRLICYNLKTIQIMKVKALVGLGR